MTLYIMLVFDLVHLGRSLRGDVISCCLSPHSSNFRLHDAPIGEPEVGVKGHLRRRRRGSYHWSLPPGTCHPLLLQLMLVLMVLVWLMLLVVVLLSMMLRVLFVDSKSLSSLLSFLCPYGI